MPESLPDPGGWSFPFDPPSPDEPRDAASSRAPMRRASALGAAAYRWSPSLSPSVPPPPPPPIPRHIRRLARRAFVLGLAVPLGLSAGTAIGAWLGTEPVVELDDGPPTVEVRAATDGRFWGLPPNDRVRVPRTSDRR